MWPFRLVMLIVLAGIAVGVFFVVRAITTGGEQNPGIGLPVPAVVVTAHS